MNIIRSIAQMQEYARTTRKEGHTIGFVPTMGFLHEGHLSLIEASMRASEVTVVSIFVNPTQFAQGEDFNTYPRDFDADRLKCEQAGVDVLFCPDSGDMFSEGSSTIVREKVLSRPLCGLSRAGHFEGVTTVVAKLFNIVMPDIAVFGQKDAQQVRIIETMVQDLSIPLNIVIAPIVRSEDGLALSSRNAYLSTDERKRALSISKSLFAARDIVIDKGERDSAVIKESITATIKDNGLEIEYIEIVDYITLKSISNLQGVVLVAVAAIIGKTRLIDNIIVTL